MRNESFFSAPQLKRHPLGGGTKRIFFPKQTEPRPAEASGSTLLNDIARGVAYGAGVAVLCTVLLGIGLERGAQDLPGSPRAFLAWYWSAGLVGGAIWGALHRYRQRLSGYLLSGAVVGAVVTSPLAVLVPLDEHSRFEFSFLLIAAAAGIPAGVLIGLGLWMRRNRA